MFHLNACVVINKLIHFLFHLSLRNKYCNIFTIAKRETPDQILPKYGHKYLFDATTRKLFIYSE